MGLIWLRILATNPISLPIPRDSVSSFPPFHLSLICWEENRRLSQLLQIQARLQKPRNSRFSRPSPQMPPPPQELTWRVLLLVTAATSLLTAAASFFVLRAAASSAPKPPKAAAQSSRRPRRSSSSAAATAHSPSAELPTMAQDEGGCRLRCYLYATAGHSPYRT